MNRHLWKSFTIVFLVGMNLWMANQLHQRARQFLQVSADCQTFIAVNKQMESLNKKLMSDNTDLFKQNRQLIFACTELEKTRNSGEFDAALFGYAECKLGTNNPDFWNGCRVLFNQTNLPAR